MKALKLQYDNLNYVESINLEMGYIIGNDLPILQKIKDYAINSGGKRVRSLLSCYLAELYQQSEHDIIALAAVVEIIHAASLLHDDVLDGAEVRRNKPSGQMIFGAKEVILAGDYMLACAIRKLNEFDHPPLMNIFTKSIKDLNVSELLQMEYQNNKDITLDIYNKIIFGKTASLFKTACQAVAIRTSQPLEEIQRIGTFGEKIGLLFQMRDDYLDYFNASLLNKNGLQDFENGYYTFPVLLLRDKLHPELKEEINNYFTLDVEARKEQKTQNEFINLMKKHKTQEAVIEKLTQIKNDLLSILSTFPASQTRKKIENQIHQLMKI